MDNAVNENKKMTVSEFIKNFPEIANIIQAAFEQQLEPSERKYLYADVVDAKGTFLGAVLNICFSEGRSVASLVRHTRNGVLPTKEAIDMIRKIVFLEGGKIETWEDFHEEEKRLCVDAKLEKNVDPLCENVHAYDVVKGKGISPEEFKKFFLEIAFEDVFKGHKLGALMTRSIFNISSLLFQESTGKKLIDLAKTASDWLVKAVDLFDNEFKKKESEGYDVSQQMTEYNSDKVQYISKVYNELSLDLKNNFGYESKVSDYILSHETVHNEEINKIAPDINKYFSDKNSERSGIGLYNFYRPLIKKIDGDSALNLLENIGMNCDDRIKQIVLLRPDILNNLFKYLGNFDKKEDFIASASNFIYLLRDYLKTIYKSKELTQEDISVMFDSKAINDKVFGAYNFSNILEQLMNNTSNLETMKLKANLGLLNWQDDNNYILNRHIGEALSDSDLAYPVFKDKLLSELTECIDGLNEENNILVNEGQGRYGEEQRNVIEQLEELQSGLDKGDKDVKSLIRKFPQYKPSAQGKNDAKIKNAQERFAGLLSLYEKRLRFFYGLDGGFGSEVKMIVSYMLHLAKNEEQKNDTINSSKVLYGILANDKLQILEPYDANFCARIFELVNNETFRELLRDEGFKSNIKSLFDCLYESIDAKEIENLDGRMKDISSQIREIRSSRTIFKDKKIDKLNQEFKSLQNKKRDIMDQISRKVRSLYVFVTNQRNILDSGIDREEKANLLKRNFRNKGECFKAGDFSIDKSGITAQSVDDIPVKNFRQQVENIVRQYIKDKNIKCDESDYHKIVELIIRENFFNRDIAEFTDEYANGTRHISLSAAAEVENNVERSMERLRNIDAPLKVAKDKIDKSNSYTSQKTNRDLSVQHLKPMLQPLTNYKAKKRRFPKENSEIKMAEMSFKNNGSEVSGEFGSAHEITAADKLAKLLSIVAKNVDRNNEIGDGFVQYLKTAGYEITREGSNVNINLNEKSLDDALTDINKFVENNNLKVYEDIEKNSVDCSNDFDVDSLLASDAVPKEKIVLLFALKDKLDSKKYMNTINELLDSWDAKSDKFEDLGSAEVYMNAIKELEPQLQVSRLKGFYSKMPNSQSNDFVRKSDILGKYAASKLFDQNAFSAEARKQIDNIFGSIETSSQQIKDKLNKVFGDSEAKTSKKTDKIRKKKHRQKVPKTESELGTKS